MIRESHIWSFDFVSNHFCWTDCYSYCKAFELANVDKKNWTQEDTGAITDDDILGSGEDPENSGHQEVIKQMKTMAITTTATTVQSSVNTGNKLVSYPTLIRDL